MTEPKLPLTVPLELWEAVADAAKLDPAHEPNTAFADSYLSGARAYGMRLLPHTLVAHDRIRARKPVLECLERLGYKLVRPYAFGMDRARDDQARTLASMAAPSARTLHEPSAST